MTAAAIMPTHPRTALHAMSRCVARRVRLSWHRLWSPGSVLSSICNGTRTQWCSATVLSRPLPQKQHPSNIQPSRRPLTLKITRRPSRLGSAEGIRLEQPTAVSQAQDWGQAAASVTPLSSKAAGQAGSEPHSSQPRRSSPTTRGKGTVAAVPAAAARAAPIAAALMVATAAVEEGQPPAGGRLPTAVPVGAAIDQARRQA